MCFCCTGTGLWLSLLLSVYWSQLHTSILQLPFPANGLGWILGHLAGKGIRILRNLDLRKKTTLKWVHKRKASESFPQMFGSSRLIDTSATGSKELKVNPINAVDGMWMEWHRSKLEHGIFSSVTRINKCRMWFWNSKLVADISRAL